MTTIIWDQPGERTYETGVDHGVLYPQNGAGAYPLGVPWNGLVTVTESPSGAEATPQYADNIKYLNLVSAEQFEGTIEAFTYPSEFEACDGSAQPEPGVLIGQQARQPFGMCYRTLKGNDTEGIDHGFKIHLVYGAVCAPSEKAHGTINETPEALTFSWAITTTPVAVTGFKPTATLTLDSTLVDADALDNLLDMLYGTVGTDPSLPMPDAVLALFSGTVVVATPTVPAFNDETNTITIPSVAGVVYTINGEVVTGTVVITENTLVTASPLPGYKFPVPFDNDWLYTYSA